MNASAAGAAAVPARRRRSAQGYAGLADAEGGFAPVDRPGGAAPFRATTARTPTSASNGGT